MKTKSRTSIRGLHLQGLTSAGGASARESHMETFCPLRGEHPFCAGFPEGVAIHTSAICYGQLYAN